MARPSTASGWRAGFVVTPAPGAGREAFGLPATERRSEGARDSSPGATIARNLDYTRWTDGCRSAVPGVVSRNPYDLAMANLLERVTIEPGKCGGRPCIRNTRMRVSDVLELLANGASTDEVLAEHPSLERDDVLAAIAYAAVQTRHPVVRVA